MATSSLGWDNFFSTTLSSGITASSTTIPLNSVPTASEGYLVIEPDSASAREIIYYTSKTGSGVVCPSVGAGRGVGGTSAASHSQNATVKMNVVAEMFEALQDGTGLGDDSINPSKLLGGAELIFDHVASGLVWSGDSYGSTLAASMTSGVVYIGGVRVAVSAVTARSFTASKDTYIDVGADGTVDYTEVANNAASPALAASHIRIGIIVTDGTDIQNAGAVNQGQEDKVLPIASSIAYSVTDSLGNLICPRDPHRKLLGLRQIVSSFAPGTTNETLITGLNTPVIIPTGRKVKVTLFDYAVTVASGITEYAIYEGVFGSGGVKVQQFNGTTTNGGLIADRTYTPTSGSVTFTGTIKESAANPTINAASTTPAYLRVELA